MVATAQLEIVQNWPKKDRLNHSCGKRITPGFDDGPLANDASSKGSLSFVSPTHTCSRYFLELFLQRSPPRLLTAAAWSGLGPAPESRSRGANPHLPHSLSTQSVRSR